MSQLAQPVAKMSWDQSPLLSENFRPQKKILLSSHFSITCILFHNFSSKMEEIRMQEWGHFYNEKDLDCCKAWYINTTDFNYDEAVSDFGFEGSSWNDLVQENRSLVPLLITEFPSMEEDLMEITDLQENPEEEMVFDEILVDCSSNRVQRPCNELGAASKLKVQSPGEEDLGDITDGLMMEEGKDFEEEGKDFDSLCGDSGDDISVSNNYPTEAEECSVANKSMSSETGNSSQSVDLDWSSTGMIPCNGDSAEYRGLRLVHLLTVCAEAISEGAHDLVEIILARLGELVSPSGSTMERVAYYLSQSLHHRHKCSGYLVQNSNRTKDPNHMGAFNLLNQVYPYIRFAHFTANQSILEAVTPQTQKVHIIDFDIMEGMQWPPLMEALKRENCKIENLKITAIKWNEMGNDSCCSKHTGRRLSEYASSLGVPFSFQETQLEKLERNLFCKEDETVIVNCMWELPHMLERSRKQLTEFLDAARRLNPAILTVGSGPHGIQSYQDLNFLERFEGCMRNICAVFDSLEAGLSEQYGLARAVVERLFVGPLMCRPLHYSEHQEDLLISDIPLKCGFIQGNISGKNTIYAECMGEEGRYYRVEKLGQNQLLLRWHSASLTSISVWKATDLV